MAAYLSVSDESSSERVIEKSRFITYCQHVESEDEAKAFLAGLHTQHLTRAYASCAAEGLNGAEIVLYDLCAEIAVGVAYPDVKTLTRFAEGKTVTGREYAEKTIFCFRVRECEEETFFAAVQNEFRGRAEIERLGKKYYPCK